MSNATNKKQSEHLVKWMQKYPDMATFATSRTKPERYQIWKTIERELNDLGPPKKSSFEWKKVWSDKKKYVKKKWLENLKARSSADEASVTEYKFSKLEDIIINICEFNQQTEELQREQQSERPSCSKKRRSDECHKPQDYSTDVDVQLEEDPLIKCEITSLDDSRPPLGSEDVSIKLETSSVDGSSHELDSDNEEQNTRLNSELPSANYRRRKPSKTQESHPKGIYLDEELFDLVGDIVPTIRNYSDTMNVGLQRVCASIDRLCSQRKALYDEKKRHNLEMERLRKLEIRAKLRLLEIEEAKLKKSL